MKNTIKLFGMLILAASLMMAGNVYAQSSKAEKKENKEMQKKQDELRKQVNENAGKKFVKQAKKLEKEGWESIGGLSIDKQLENSAMKRTEEDETGYPRYICEVVQVTAETYSVAQSQASNVAKTRIASDIASSIGALAELALANQELSAEEAASITKSLENVKVLVSQKLGRTLKTLEIDRVLRNGNYQIQVQICYDMKAAIAIAREVMLDELKKDLDINKAQLENFMGMDKLQQQITKDMPNYDEVAE